MSFWQEVDNIKNESYVIVTLIDVKGSAPQDTGAKALITERGIQAGTVGGGKIEARAITFAQEILKNQEHTKPELKSWNLQTDIGMTCGGAVTLLFEHFYTQNFPIVIFGAGHVAQALTRTLANLNCQITCIDSRFEWVEKLPKGIKTICHPNPAELVSELNPQSFFISMTMGHAHDVPILQALSQHAPNCPYVGVIGSEVKGKKIKSELKENGVAGDFITKLRCPIGLPLGTNHVYEIAISITAELLQVRGG
jgi:xanthine dehydrogenase accessory factor